MAACRKMIAPLVALMAAHAIAAPAMAQITPEDVWQNWQVASAAMGQTLIAASTSREGATLTISDVTIASANDGVTVQGNLDQILMQDQGDGTVLVTMPPQYPLRMTMPSDTAQPTQLDILIAQEDFTMLASGAPNELRYDLTAPTVTVTLARIEGQDTSAANLTVTATLSDISGSYTTRSDAGAMTADTDIAVAGLALAVIGANAADQSELRLTAAMLGLGVKATGALMGAISPVSVAMLNSTSDLRSDQVEFDLEIVDPLGATTIKGTGAEGMVSAKIAEGAMQYSTSQNMLNVVVNAPTIPLPDLGITLQQAAISVMSPLIPTDTAEPFAFEVALRNLALSDQLWAIFDPTAALPRDPINLVIETEGMAKINSGAAGQAYPAEVETLNLKTLEMNIAGAELSGSGQTTFAPDEGGTPNPSGVFDLSLLGANGLMGKLVDGGFLSVEALTFPRMMLAMVATPAADGSDSYSAKIEIRDKAVFANGQMLHQMP
jgi:hypothetical protein